MENRFLCRGKRIDNGEWVEGYYCKWLKGKLVITYSEKEVDCIITWMSNGGMSRYEVDPSTICQYTGLKDKNGKLIWENDIVKFPDTECYGYIGWNESKAGFYFNVLLEGGRFEEEHIYDYQDCIEVIGNTFDNPELLEV